MMCENASASFEIAGSVRNHRLEKAAFQPAFRPPVLTTFICVVFFASVALVATPAAPIAASSDEVRANAAFAAASAEVDDFQDFERIAAEAKKIGITEQAIVEAELLYCLRNDDTSRLVSLIPRIETKLPIWREPDSPFFKERHELEALIHMATGMLAASKHDEAAFEQEMKTAFWSDPTLAKALAERVVAFREKQAMRRLVLPMDLTLETSAGKKTTLGELVKGQRGLLLDFWASWCSPCMSLMNELPKQAQDLAPQNVRVFGMNTESDRGKAEKVRNEKKISCAWLIEPEKRPLSTLLKVDSIPRAVLVTPDGKIAFNGHPADTGLATALSGLRSESKTTGLSGSEFSTPAAEK